MSTKYSPSTGGFYVDEIHGGAIPADAITITAGQHADMLAALNSGGSVDVMDGVATVTAAADLIQTLAEFQSSLAAQVEGRRYAVETGGIIVNGTSISTSIADQNRLTSVVANALAAGIESVDFKASSGWVTLSVAQVAAIAAAVGKHVRACFTAERTHAIAISKLASTADAAAYDVGAGWPSTTYTTEG